MRLYCEFVDENKDPVSLYKFIYNYLHVIPDSEGIFIDLILSTNLIYGSFKLLKSAITQNRSGLP